MKKEQKVSEFLDNKNKVIFISLLSLLEEDNLEGKKALEKCYDISGQPEKLVGEFLEWSQKNEISWTQGWPNNLLTGVF